MFSNLRIVKRSTVTDSSKLKKTDKAKKNEVNTAIVAIDHTITFGNFFPKTPLINTPINGIAIINGISCSIDILLNL